MPPKVLLSYSHDSPEHMDRVLAICDRLRADGIDAWIDQYEIPPPEGWPRWWVKRFEEADFVLVVCTETYERRFRGAEEPGRGLGGQWEGFVIYQELAEAAVRSSKLIPIFFSPAVPEHIPTVLRSVSSYDVSGDKGYWRLVRHLTGQPETLAPPLGSPALLPPRERRADQAAVKGSGAIAQGPGAVAAGAGGIAVGGDVQGDVLLGPDQPPKPPHPRKRPPARSTPDRPEAPLPMSAPIFESNRGGDLLGSFSTTAEPTVPDPPRTAYARLDALEVAVAGVEMEVVAGLADKPSPGVAGRPMTRPATSVGPYTLSIQLVADGFRLREGETLRRTMPVTAEEPYPATVFHLTAEPQTKDVHARTLQAFYEVEGQTIGLAVRPVAVVRSPELVAGAPKPAGSAGVALALPTDMAAADLEIRILLDRDHPGRLLWTFTSPHTAVALADKALTTEIGDGKSFARSIVDEVNSREGKAGIYQILAGIGVKIARQMPDEIWGYLAAVATRAKNGIPNVLILSQEPYVPWELARFDAPLLDPAAPPFLAAQANIGRWVLPRQSPDSRQRPRQPPPTEVQVHSVAVISGVYDRPGWNRLLEAEGEADDLHKGYGATKVEASSVNVLTCLAGDPSADLLHFAVHGIYDPNSTQDGLMLTDGEILSPFEVAGSELGKAPFVFLNACQVGEGNQVLGDYSGLAAEFLTAGASGVVAPLWSIKDTIAREIARDFYYATAEGLAGPAAALRDARKAFKSGLAPQSATYLAYQFFGHPALKLRFSKREEV